MPEDWKQKTLDYYANHADSFNQDTFHLDFSFAQDKFLELGSEGDLILDFGCGTGRDTGYFLDHNRNVEACDGSPAMCKIASENLHRPVKHMLFDELDEREKYDAIWACSSLLHVPAQNLPGIFRRMEKALKPQGYIYCSFKYGDFEGERNGRYFTDLNEEGLKNILQDISRLKIRNTWISSDVRQGREKELWLNALIQKT